MAGIFTVKVGAGKSIDINQFPPEAWRRVLGAEEHEGDIIDLYRRVPWLSRGIDLLGNSLSAMPFTIYNARGDEIDTSDNYQNATGLWVDPFRDLYLAEAAITLYGCAYFLKLAKKNKQPRGLRYLVPSSVQPVVDRDAGLVGFRRSENGRAVDFGLDELVYIDRPDPQVEAGKSQNSRAAAAVAAALVLRNADQFAAEFFEKGMIKTTLLAVSGGVSQDDLTRIGSIWSRIMRGMKSAYEKLVVNADAVTPITIGEGLAELSNATLTAEKREDISTALGIPHSLLFSNAANYATAEQDERNLYNTTIVPDARLIAEAMNRQYFGPAGYQLVFDQSSLAVFQEDEEDRSGALMNIVNATRTASPEVVSVAMQMLGFNLPGGMEWTEFEAILANGAPAAAPVVAQPAPASPEAVDEGDEYEEPIKTAFELDLERWERKAIKALKSHRPAAVDFSSDNIPDEIRYLILDMLAEVRTPDQVRAIFRAGQDVPPASGSGGAMSGYGVGGGVHVHLPEIKMSAPVVTVEVPPIQVPEIKIPEIVVPAPMVNVMVPEQGAPQVIVNVPEQPAPVVNVENTVEFPRAAQERTTVRRDAQGRIISTESETIYEPQK